MAALWNIGAAALSALPAIVRIAWDLRWYSALQGHARLPMDETHLAERAPASHGVTLIVCTHNDLTALSAMWAAWRGQRFPEGWSAEWLVVDDGSTDGTAAWLQAQPAAPDLTILHHTKSAPGKKQALAAGIRAARYDTLILTDADCTPAPQWAWSLASALAQKESASDTPGTPATPRWDVVLGTCLPDGGPPLLAFDALRVALQYNGEATIGAPYMGVGRSIAYRRSTWEACGGFEGHADLSSGDDDLFVQDALRAGFKVGPGPRPSMATQVQSQPAPNARDGWIRKRRHLSTSGRYSGRARARLALDAALDPLVLFAALSAPFGLLHRHVWIPAVLLALASTVRAFTLSSFSRWWGDGAFPMWQCMWWGPIRWTLLALATVQNAFTSSPTWTQRAPTRRS